jgi:hypothetical protein
MAPNGPAAIHITAGDSSNVPLGSTVNVAVMVVDARGRGVPAINVIWGKTSCCSELSAQSSVTSDQGVAQTSWTLQSAGNHALTVGIDGMPSSSVTLHATAFASVGPSDFVVTVLDPRPDVLVGDSVDVSVEVNTSRALSSVTASASATETRLTYVSTSGAGTFWKGRVSMQGTPRDNVLLTAIAVDVNGVSSKGLVTIIHDSPPRIIVHAPLNNSVATPNIDYWIECVDDDPAGCKSLAISTITADNPAGRTIATGTSTLKGTATLANGLNSVQIGAKDSRGQTTGAQRLVYAVTTTHLQELISGLGSALDYRSNRLLFSASDSAAYRLAIRSSDGHDELIPLDSQPLPIEGILTSTGTAFAAVRSGQPSLNFWRNGNLTTIDAPYTVPGLTAEGDYVLYFLPLASGSFVSSLNRRNVVTDEDIVIASSPNSAALGPNGDVAFGSGNGDWNVYWYHGGSTNPLTSDGNQSAMNIMPVTDGTQVLFVRQTPCCNVGTPMYAIMRFDGTTVTELAPPAPGSQPVTHRTYDARVGWAAFMKPDGFNVPQLWTRSPSGDVRQVSTFATPGQLMTLGDDGSVIFSSAGRDYFAMPGGTPIDLGAIPGRFVWRDGMFVALIGRSALRIVP